MPLAAAVPLDQRLHNRLVLVEQIPHDQPEHVSSGALAGERVPGVVGVAHAVELDSGTGNPVGRKDPRQENVPRRIEVRHQLQHLHVARRVPAGDLTRKPAEYDWLLSTGVEDYFDSAYHWSHMHPGGRYEIYHGEDAGL